MTDMRTCLWFVDEAEAAVARYSEVLPGLTVSDTMRAGDDGPVITIAFEVLGHRLLALNGRRDVEFTPAVSLAVTCDSQEEADRIWYGLLEGGGTESMCGWLVDAFGVSWQVVPREALELLGDPQVGGAATEAMLAMTRIDVAAMRAAAEA